MHSRVHGANNTNSAFKCAYKPAECKRDIDCMLNASYIIEKTLLASGTHTRTHAHTHVSNIHFSLSIYNERINRQRVRIYFHLSPIHLVNLFYFSYSSLLIDLDMPSLIRAQLHEEYNQLSTFELSILAQELVQETINKSAEVAQTTRSIITHLLSADHSIFLQRKARIEELLNGFETLLLRLRVAGAIINQRKMDKDKDRESGEPVSNTELVERLTVEKAELVKQVQLKNDYLKFSIDKVSDIIWQINAMQTLKH